MSFEGSDEDGLFIIHYTEYRHLVRGRGGYIDIGGLVFIVYPGSCPNSEWHTQPLGYPLVFLCQCGFRGFPTRTYRAVIENVGQKV